MELEWMRKYEQMQEQLSGPYREVFAAAKGYGVMTNAAPELLTDRLTELYDLLLTAQAEGCAVQRVVGKDTEVFCKEFFAESSPSRRLGTLAGRLYRYVWVLFLLEGLPLLAADSAPAQGLFLAKVFFSPDEWQTYQPIIPPFDWNKVREV